MSSSDYYSDDPANFQRPKSKKRFSGVLALIAALIGGTLYIQSTLAANISLNSGSADEFGQGVAQTLACDSDGIILIPESTFVNQSNGGSFRISSVVASGVDSSQTGCAGKKLILKIFGDTSSSPTGTLVVRVASSGTTYFAAEPEPSADLGFTFTSSDAQSFIITINPEILILEASSFYKITLESSD